ncbi:MAG: hypothetical protein L3J20_08150 [Flavobacteriaceae bacterium]|nr:hypothetical protein [Flavobacteriaceae bacterium]
MIFLEKIKTPIFWKSTLKVTIPFFIALIIISLLFNSFSNIINFDLEAIKAANFSDGKWKQFLLTKSVVSLLYGIWITNRNMK